MTVQARRDKRIFESLIYKYGKDEVKNVLNSLVEKNISESKKDEDDIEIILTD